MPEQIIIQAMGREKARALTDLAKEHLEAARRNILDVYEAEGWKSLGYDSFKAYAEKEFTQSWQQVYKIVSAAKVDRNLMEITGESYLVPVNHGKVLAKLSSPALQHEAYQLASMQADAQGEDVTQKKIESAVRTVEARERVRQSEHKVVQQMVASDEITAHHGVELVKELDKLGHDGRLFVQRLMAKYNLQDAELAYLIGYRFEKRGYDSKVIQEIERTGRLAGVPLAKATVSHWKRANAEAQKEHISEKEEEKREAQRQQNLPVEIPVIVTVYQNNPVRTIKALIEALSVKDIEQLHHATLAYMNHMGWVSDDDGYNSDVEKWEAEIRKIAKKKDSA